MNVMKRLVWSLMVFAAGVALAVLFTLPASAVTGVWTTGPTMDKGGTVVTDIVAFSPNAFVDATPSYSGNLYNSESGWSRKWDDDILVNHYWTDGSLYARAKIIGVKSSCVITWTFAAGDYKTLTDVRVCMQWGDGARSSGTISSVTFTDKDDVATVVSPAACYVPAGGCGNYFWLKAPEGEVLGTNVKSVKITFGTLNNGGVGIAEMEALAVDMTRPHLQSAEAFNAVSDAGQPVDRVAATSVGLVTEAWACYSQTAADLDELSTCARAALAVSSTGPDAYEAVGDLPALEPQETYYVKVVLANGKEGEEAVSDVITYTSVDSTRVLGSGGDIAYATDGTGDVIHRFAVGTWTFRAPPGAIELAYSLVGTGGDAVAGQVLLAGGEKGTVTVGDTTSLSIAGNAFEAVGGAGTAAATALLRYHPPEKSLALALEPDVAVAATRVDAQLACFSRGGGTTATIEAALAAGTDAPTAGFETLKTGAVVGETVAKLWTGLTPGVTYTAAFRVTDETTSETKVFAETFACLPAQTGDDPIGELKSVTVDSVSGEAMVKFGVTWPGSGSDTVTATLLYGASPEALTEEAVLDTAAICTRTVPFVLPAYGVPYYFAVRFTGENGSMTTEATAEPILLTAAELGEVLFKADANEIKVSGVLPASGDGTTYLYFDYGATAETMTNSAKIATFAAKGTSLDFSGTVTIKDLELSKIFWRLRAVASVGATSATTNGDASAAYLGNARFVSVAARAMRVAFNSSMTDFYDSATELKWDLCFSKRVDAIRILPRIDNYNNIVGRIKAFTIYASNDGANWTAVASRTADSGNFDKAGELFPLSDAGPWRYFRIGGTTAQQNFAEIETLSLEPTIRTSQIVTFDGNGKSLTVSDRIPPVAKGTLAGLCVGERVPVVLCVARRNCGERYEDWVSSYGSLQINLGNCFNGDLSATIDHSFIPGRRYTRFFVQKCGRWYPANEVRDFCLGSVASTKAVYYCYANGSAKPVDANLGTFLDNQTTDFACYVDMTQLDDLPAVLRLIFRQDNLGIIDRMSYFAVDYTTDEIDWSSCTPTAVSVTGRTVYTIAAKPSSVTWTPFLHFGNETLDMSRFETDLPLGNLPKKATAIRIYGVDPFCYWNIADMEFRDVPRIPGTLIYIK